MGVFFLSDSYVDPWPTVREARDSSGRRVGLRQCHEPPNIGPLDSHRTLDQAPGVT
jgi:hypothetical protein